MATRDISLPRAVDETQNTIPIDQSNENDLGEEENRREVLETNGKMQKRLVAAELLFSKTLQKLC